MIPTFIIIFLVGTGEIIHGADYGPVVSHKCKAHSVSLLRKLNKAVINLRFQQTLSTWNLSSFLLGKEDAEYFFYQQEAYRNCLIKETEMNPYKGAFYFKKYHLKNELNSAEYLCEGNVDPSILRKRCDQVLKDINTVRGEVSWMPDYRFNTDPPRCVDLNVKIQTKNYMTVRRLLKCPGVFADDDLRQTRNGIFLSVADDPKFKRCLIYVLKWVKETAALNIQIHSLMVTWKPLV